jgi:hypothetical protein
VKITGTITDDHGHAGVKRLALDLDLRDLFAAFALAAVVALDLEDATHKSDAAYAYAAADAMLEVRALSAREETR